MFPVTKSPIFKCPKCGKPDFELAKLGLDNTKFMPAVIKCKKCNTLIGTVPMSEFLEYRKSFPAE